MIMINNLLILFGCTMFAQSSALKTIDHSPAISIVVEQFEKKGEQFEKKGEQFEKIVQANLAANSAFSVLQVNVEVKNFTEDEKEQILSAALFAAEKHQTQLREIDKAPYVAHPIDVANRLLVYANASDATIIQAALLQDVVESTNTSLEEIKGKFGEDVASLVAEVTDDASLSKEEQRRMKIVRASELSEGAALIQFSDVFCNLIDFKKYPSQGWSPEKRAEYAAWATEFVDNLSYKDSALKARFDKVITIL